MNSNLPPLSFLSSHARLFISPPGYYSTSHDDLFLDEERYIPSQTSFSLTITVLCRLLPIFYSSIHLFLRLICVPVGALCILSLLFNNFEVLFHSEKNVKQNARDTTRIAVAGIISGAILFADTMYVYEWTEAPGLFIMISVTFLSTLLSGKDQGVSQPRGCLARSHLVHSKVIIWMVFTISMGFGIHPHLPTRFYDHDLPGYSGGLYFRGENERVASLVSRWMGKNVTSGIQLDYDKHSSRVRTPYVLNGDLRTILSYLWNDPADVKYERRWIASTSQDDPTPESIALDFAFPPSGHNPSQPVYLVLHGLSGGSNEGFVRDFVLHATSRNSTTAVLVARGLMDTKVEGPALFHGARVDDIDAAVQVLRTMVGPNGVIAGVGFSMGGIMLSNYVARSGEGCALNFAVNISGGLDMRQQVKFVRSKWLWQTFMAEGLRDFVLKRAWLKIENRVGKEAVSTLLRASNVMDIIEHGFYRYNSHKYENSNQFLAEMSAMGDYKSGKPSAQGRIARVNIPLLVIFALDDPVSSHRTLGAHPEEVVETGEGNVIMAITKRGGHVGWPTGIRPWTDGWKYMNEMALNFVESGVQEDLRFHLKGKHVMWEFLPISSFF